MLPASILLLGLWTGTGFHSPAPAQAAVSHDAILLDRLNDVRELLDRRLSHREMLNGRIERYSRQLDQLQIERDETLTVLSDHEDRARSLEQELDHLMPRLLPRINRLNRVRKNGALAIAKLAEIERDAKLERQDRGRLMASQAPSIEQMRRASTAVRLLRRVPNSMIARHRDVDFQVPLLAASASRLDLQHSQLQRQRDKTIRQLALLNVDIDRLTAEEHRLARSMIARRLETANHSFIRARTLREARLDHRPKGKVTLDEAGIRGLAVLQTQPTPVARPSDMLHASVERPALQRSTASSLSAGSKAEASPAHWSTGEGDPGSATIVSLPSDRPISTHKPLVPSVEMIGYSLEASQPTAKRVAIDISAKPGQLVATPDDGRIVFAGDFRSYGLLLIIEHGSEYHTLLWGFSSLDVGLGDAVQTGQILGILRDEPSPKLHIELRRNGQPVSPEVWLAASNSGVKG
jgi:hypothetical protein